MSERLPYPEPIFISILVDESFPANQKGIILKDDNTKIISKAVITKFDELKGDLYFRAMISDEPDTDNEHYEKEDVYYAQRYHMKNLATTTKAADLNHNMLPLDGVFLAESHLVETEDGKLAYDGCYNIKENAELMQKGRDKKINGVSICAHIRKLPQEKGMIETLKTVLKDFFRNKEIKNKDEEMTEEERKALKSEIVSEVTAAVTVAMKEALKETEPKKEPEKEPEKKVEPVETEVEKALKSQIAERDKEIKELKEKEAKRKSTSEIIEKDESDDDFLARMTEAMKEEDSWKTITMKEKNKFAQLRMKKAK